MATTKDLLSKLKAKADPYIKAGKREFRKRKEQYDFNKDNPSLMIQDSEGNRKAAGPRYERLFSDKDGPQRYAKVAAEGKAKNLTDTSDPRLKDPEFFRRRNKNWRQRQSRKEIISGGGNRG